MKRCIPLLILFLFCQLSLVAQKDTLFWFVAPEITKGQIGYDDPTVFRISAFDANTLVTISMPANPSFPPQQLNIPAGSTAVLDMAPWVETIENKPANQILNKGILIHATHPVTAYYEVIGQLGSNPEIYALKGNNALGKRFYTPFQTFLENSTNPGHTPAPHAAFDIVATENNTSVTVTPTRNLMGHAANIPFTVVLNRGQTFSCEAASQAADQHPTGSLVVSDKPVAVTVKDDLLDAPPFYGGFCRDQVGDQIVPVDYLGKRYVVLPGFLDGDERVIVVATENGTIVSHNGDDSSLDAGMSATILISSVSQFITATKPIYVFHISGIGCEVAGEIMPSLDCSGSQSVRFIRTNDDPFHLLVVTRAGNENAFRINGNALLLPASSFQQVPGSNGEFVSARVQYPTSEIPAGVSTLIETVNGGLFHVGFLNGQQANGCSYGFFSDYLNKTVVQDSVVFCEGDTVRSHGLYIWQSGNYEVIADGSLDCDTIYKIKAVISQYQIARTGDLPWCPGDSIEVNGSIYTAPGIYQDTLFATGDGCDTLLVIDIVQTPYVFSFDNYELCPGSSIIIHGVEYSEPVSLLDTIPNAGIGCDTIHKIVIDWTPLEHVNDTITFCPGDTVFINDMPFSAPFLFVDTLQAIKGCHDTIRTTIGFWLDTSQIAHEIFLCPADSFLIRDRYYQAPATVVYAQDDGAPCSTSHVYNLHLYADESHLLIPDSAVAFCTGTPVVFHSPYPGTVWNNQTGSADFPVTSTGVITVRFTDMHGCMRGDTVTVNPCCDIDKIYVPNVFSPGYPPNDRFNISVNPICIPVHMRIYDRWGQFIYQTDAPQEKGWDGTYRGKYCTPGVYIWVLEITQSGQKDVQILKGDVTILR
jgi:gliding motility-associated-like protein